ncbi:hypothetical protein C6501_05330 [Candidatus Poribacteria bacterium]|nr:MAG: hypothetical protein C6501_05330 [Candidatus Poribacteria bacterium]
MRNLILYRKIFVLTLVIVLSVFGISDIGYSQFEKNTTEDNSAQFDIITTIPELSVDQIYEKAIRSVVWIRTPNGGQASGVLISRELRLAVTNAHVTNKSKRIDVYFPVRNRKGILISDRNFYVNEKNWEVLKELGYYTSGRVIAENFKTDLALISLDGLPETARQIEFSSDFELKMKINSPVEVLGNPGALDLWRWTAGRFQTVYQTENKVEQLHIKADIFGGNSGGPVLNNRGKLIGIVKESDRLMNTLAIPTKYIVELLSTLELRHIFSIKNYTVFSVPYQIKWTEDGTWVQQEPLKPGEGLIHWYTGSSDNIPSGYPQVRFDYVAGDREVTFKSYSVETYSRFFGPDIRDRVGRDMDARAYHFGYDSRTKKLTLYDSEKK